MISWPCYFGLVARQHIIVGVHDRTKPLNSWPESKRKQGGYQGLTILLESMPNDLEDLSLSLISQRFHHLPISPPWRPHL
jgi:hypothetical protein